MKWVKYVLAFIVGFVLLVISRKDRKVPADFTDVYEDEAVRQNIQDINDVRDEHKKVEEKLTPRPKPEAANSLEDAVKSWNDGV